MFVNARFGCEAKFVIFADTCRAMKRFSAREFALLSLPVALVAGAGFWAARRPAPKPSYVGPTLQFRVETPTALQAFEGVKAVLTAQVSDDSEGRSYWIDNPKVWLAVATPQGAKLWRNDKSSSGDEAWISEYPFYRDTVAVKQLPEGKVTFGMAGPIVETGKPKAPKPLVLKRQWEVERTKIKPFDFSLPRAPLVTLKSVTITKNGYYSIYGEAVFVLQGAMMDAYTPLKSRVSVSEGEPNYYQTLTFYSQKSALIRVVEFRLFTSNVTPPDLLKPRPLRVTGRISADNRWPLAFGL